MVLGVLVGKKQYALKKYIFVIMIVIGVVLFMFKDNTAGAGMKQTESSFGIGEVLLLLSLTMDGLTGAVQVVTFFTVSKI
jgi:solute carrier family 35 (UDP-galactose transporter), member B1